MKRILYVEDNFQNKRLVRKILSAKGYEVLEADDGESGVQMALDERPDLILMDIAMPEMDGLTATKIIRKLAVGAEVPIIALTANSNTFYREAIAAGCNEVIKKPFEEKKLKSLLKFYLSPNFA